MLTDKVILVVGGALGIGRATVHLCRERQAQVAIADVDVSAGQALAAETRSRFIPVDVTAAASVQALAAEVDRLYGRLDALIYTAGILRGAYTPLAALSVDTFQAVWEVNVKGAFLCVQHTAPLLQRAGSGVIVLLSSAAATGGSSSYAYGSSKGGLSSLGVTAAQKLAGAGIRVNVVAPGNIDTGMKRSVIAVEAEQAGTPLEQAVSDAKLGSPEGVARVLAWLASDEADYVRGTIVTR
jgi:NAD(P)-dependent dehydrogenase (short-subunit alcohol dehydrogenase family)